MAHFHSKQFGAVDTRTAHRSVTSAAGRAGGLKTAANRKAEKEANDAWWADEAKFHDHFGNSPICGGDLIPSEARPDEGEGEGEGDWVECGHCGKRTMK